MTELHTRLRSAIELRMQDILIHGPDHDPAWVIRACRADLDRLEEHAPVLHNIDDEPGYAHLCRSCPGHPPSPCREYRRLVAVHEVEVT